MLRRLRHQGLHKSEKGGVSPRGPGITPGHSATGGTGGLSPPRLESHHHHNNPGQAASPSHGKGQRDIRSPREDSLRGDPGARGERSIFPTAVRYATPTPGQHVRAGLRPASRTSRPSRLSPARCQRRALTTGQATEHDRPERSSMGAVSFPDLVGSPFGPWDESANIRPIW